MERPDGFVARVGAWAGWLSLVGIVGYHVALLLLAGQRVSGTSDLAAINAYYSQPVVAVASIDTFLVVLAVAVFAVALRETLVAMSAPAAAAFVRLVTGVALLAMAAQISVILVEASIQAALVSGVAVGEPVAGMFRLWDVLYNSATYGLEATWVLAFGLAMRRVAAFPRFLGWFAPLAALLLFVNVFAIWLGIPDAATLPSAVGLSVWFAASALGLGRVGRAAVTTPAMQPA